MERAHQARHCFRNKQRSRAAKPGPRGPQVGLSRIYVVAEVLAVLSVIQALDAHHCFNVPP